MICLAFYVAAFYFYFFWILILIEQKFIIPTHSPNQFMIHVNINYCNIIFYINHSHTYLYIAR